MSSHSVSNHGEPSAQDTRFSLPAVGAPASQEVGVILMGQEIETLLVGLGATSLAADPAAAFLLADQVRHAGVITLTLDHLVRVGADHWRMERELPGPASDYLPLRESWERTYRALREGQAGAGGPARLAYLTACWLRRSEVDHYTDTHLDGFR